MTGFISVNGTAKLSLFSESQATNFFIVFSDDTTEYPEQRSMFTKKQSTCLTGVTALSQLTSYEVSVQLSSQVTEQLYHPEPYQDERSILLRLDKSYQ